METRRRRLVRWATRRAWSRAGAVAAVLSAGAPRRVLVTSSRVALHLAGSVVIGTAIAVMLWNDIGPGPLDVFVVGLRASTGIPLAAAVWFAFGLMAVLAWALGRRPGLGTVAAPLVIGPVMQSVVAVLDGAEPPGGSVARLAVHVAAVGAAGLGAGALIVAGLGAGTGELLATAAADRTGRGESPMRLVCEATWLVTGIALGGPVGPGTVLVAILIGPAVAVGHRVVDDAVGRSRRVAAALPRHAMT